MLMDTVATIASWMDTMHLKLNPDKTEFIMFGCRSQLVKCTTNCVNISDSTIPRSQVLNILELHWMKTLALKSTYFLNIERQWLTL